MDTQTYVVTSPSTYPCPPLIALSKKDPRRNWVRIGAGEFCYPGGKYLDMRPVDDPESGGSFCLTRGAFTHMIVLINKRHYDAPKVNRQALEERMNLNGVHRLWINAGDLEYSFDGVDRVDLLSKESSDPHRRKPEHVWSFDLYALYQILAVFTTDPYAE